MLKNLRIQNYALIENLDIDFNQGYSVITGETGAGKSVMIGALSLILGSRADTSVLKNKDKKCVAEAEFDIQRYSLKVFFDKNDIDYDEITIIRREIMPGGRSRAFVNDTPVNLNTLKEIGKYLTDIHSQHQNLSLNDNEFQLKVLDAFAGLENILDKYRIKYFDFVKLKKEYRELTEKAKKEKSDLEFLQFQFDELDAAKLKTGEQEETEAELKQLNHSEEIIENLTYSYSLISDEENGITENIRNSLAALKQIQGFFSKINPFIERLESVKIELADISSELESLVEDVEYNPERAEYLKERLDTFYALQTKHKVNSVEELMEIKEKLQTKLNEITSYDSQIAEKKKQLEKTEQELSETANILSQKRQEASAVSAKEITEILQRLGMPNVKFEIKRQDTGEYTKNGKDKISFLFSANKHSEPKEISETASGGEISRLMLAIKSVISENTALPAIIFDEIDTGVSGEIAEKIGMIMKKMSENMQVISITHLPQVAAKADTHYKVYKIEDEFDTRTNIKKLDEEERIKEIASMLSGENLTEAAIKNAKELLK
ncbi:MAG: DNA repair protein RecN [Chlorobi bacterium]|nr:DNA repair protein RecN [Chlorobiota bacterium]